MQAIILVGGQGTRLRPVVSDVPKPMAPIRGRPFLAYLLDALEAQGFTEIVLAVGYLRDILMQTFGERHGRLRLRYSVEETPLGTGGAIRQAFAAVSGWPVFVLNGDTFLELNCAAMLDAHEAAGAELTMALTHVADATRYGRVLTEAGRVTGFEPAGRPGPGLINAGVYLFAATAMAPAELPEAFSFERDFLVPHLSRLCPLAHAVSGYFIDIGIPEDFARAQTELTPYTNPAKG